MATLRTVGGLQYSFNPKTVAVIADHDASTGEAVTCLYGLTNGTLKINESVQDFMSRVRIKANFAQLTRANGSPVWINGSVVSAVRAPLQNEYVAAVNAVVFTSALTQGVREFLVMLRQRSMLTAESCSTVNVMAAARNRASGLVRAPETVILSDEPGSSQSFTSV